MSWWPFGKSRSGLETEADADLAQQNLTDRYAGKPFLKLLDSYVLRAIGHLDQETEQRWIAMLPKLQETFRSSGGWVEIVEEQMEFSSTMEGEIKRRWDEGRERFVASTGSEPDPLKFTYEFVDTNFQPTKH